MAEALSTFSESWYRVAGLRVGLRPHVQVRRQFFRGRRWFVVYDPFNNQFFRLQPAAWEFVARLRPSSTVEEVWKECLARDPENAPGQEDVIRLLAQLYFANLLQYDLPGDSTKLFERYKQRRQREVQSQLLNIMFVRFPLLDPDEFLNRWNGVVGKLFSPVGAVLWLLVMIAAVKVGIDHFEGLKEQSQGVLAPGNLFLLYLGLVITKTLHEFGHAFACKKYGGEVHVMGIMLLIFTPIPYVDATSSWAFRNRWHRILVGAAGMIVEVFLAGCAMFVWANTSPGVIHSLAYNMIFIASVSTVLFNANPLLRFDGYYILSDLLDIPNLHFRATGHLRHLAERYLFGCRDSESPSESLRESVWLTVFGILSGIYRVIVFTGILLFVADRFLLAGIVMLVICVISWVIVPIGKFFRYLATGPRLERNRVRAVSVTMGLVAVVFIGLGLIPFPHHFRAPGVLEGEEYTYVVNMAGGFLEELHVSSGVTVQAGQPLARFRNLELEKMYREAEAQMEETNALYRRALDLERADLDPILRRREAIEKQLARLEEELESLTLTAPLTGVWVSPDLENHLGNWIPRGTAVGQIVNPSGFLFSSIVDQDDASRLFAGEIRGSDVRLYGQAGRVLEVVDQKIIPAEQEILPSVALGWLGGGEVPVDVTDPSGRKAAEPFYEVLSTVRREPGRSTIETRAQADDIQLLHGRSGKIRFDLKPKPLLQQWIRRLRQLLQRRYQI